MRLVLSFNNVAFEHKLQNNTKIVIEFTDRRFCAEVIWTPLSLQYLEIVRNANICFIYLKAIMHVSRIYL